MRLAGLAAYWFGLYFLFTPVGSSLAPAQINDLVPEARQALAQGVLLAAGAGFAVVVPPLVGAYSDRLHTRWGRRRPVIVVGTAGTMLSLLVMMTASGYPQLLAGYALVQLWSNAAGAAYAALIPDVVPGAETGAASGHLSLMTLLGSAGGLGLNVVAAQLHARQAAYAGIALVLALSALPTLRAAAVEARLPRPQRPQRPPLREQAGTVLQLVFRGDFAWVLGTRLLITAGISTISPFLLFFFRDVVHVGNADVFTPLWLLVVVLFAAPTGLLGGRFSDRLGRKRFVYASGALQALVAVVFVALYPTQVPLVLLLAAVYGAGYGMYTAVDWALACDTLPDRENTARDMGLFHIALSLPGQVVPALAGLALSVLNDRSPNSGYRVVFGAAIGFFVLGTVLVRQVRGVR